MSLSPLQREYFAGLFKSQWDKLNAGHTIHVEPRQLALDFAKEIFDELCRVAGGQLLAWPSKAFNEETGLTHMLEDLLGVKSCQQSIEGDLEAMTLSTASRLGLLRRDLTCTIYGAASEVGRSFNQSRPAANTILPLEILVHSFSFLPFNALIQATHTCHYWRSAAVNAASLWTTLTLPGRLFDPSAGVMNLLNRSKELPLDLNLVELHSDYLAPMARILDAVLCRTHILQLDLQSTEPAYLDALWSAMRIPAPVLQILEFSLSPSHVEEQDATRHSEHYDSFDIALPRDLFLGHAPRLTDFTTSGPLRLPPVCPALKSVTTLGCQLLDPYDDAASDSHNGEPNLDGLFDMNRLVPSLQSLCIPRLNALPHTGVILPKGLESLVLWDLLPCADEGSVSAALQSIASWNIESICVRQALAPDLALACLVRDLPTPWTKIQLAVDPWTSEHDEPMIEVVVSSKQQERVVMCQRKDLAKVVNSVTDIVKERHVPMEIAKTHLRSLSASRSIVPQIGALLAEPAKLQSEGIIGEGVVLDMQLLRQLVDHVTHAAQDEAPGPLPPLS